VSQPKIAKKSLKTHLFGVQGHSRSSTLVPPESSSAVLVMIRNKSVSICKHSRARLVDSSRNRTFSRVPLSDALIRGESRHPVAPNYLVRN